MLSRAELKDSTAVLLKPGRARDLKSQAEIP